MIHSECTPGSSIQGGHSTPSSGRPGEARFCLRGETGAMQNQQALLVTYSFLLIDVVIFYSPWSVLSCDKQKTDIPYENETILFTPPSRLFAYCPY